MSVTAGFRNPQTTTLRVLYSRSEILSHTGDTNEFSVDSFLLPGRTMGPKGMLRFTITCTATNNGNNKQIKVKLGSASVVNIAFVSQASNTIQKVVANRESETSQVSFNAGSTTGIGQTTTAIATYSVDTSVDQTVDFTLTLANSADTAAFESILVELIRIT